MNKVLIFSLNLVFVFFILFTFLVKTVIAESGFNCSAELRKRTPTEVVEDLHSAIAAGDWHAVACNYETEGYVIDGQSIMVGLDEILDGIISFNDVFCDIQPVSMRKKVFSNTVRVTYKLEGGWISISNGVNTYRVENGKIVSQNNQGLITYSGSPPTDWCYDTL